jgi:pentatricopeptide repeat protein
MFLRCPPAKFGNKILLGLCKRCEIDNAIDFFAYMVSNGCMPNESTYIILIEGLAHESLLKEAQDLLSVLCSRGVVSKNLIEE